MKAPLSICRPYSTCPKVRATDEDLCAARHWFSAFNKDTIPRRIGNLSFARSSGPGGQNVNKVSSKATLRIPLYTLFAHVPPLLHPLIKSSRYYAQRSNEIIVQADESRKQSENIEICFEKLHNMLLQSGREAIPRKTSPEKAKRVEVLQKIEVSRRKKSKQHHSMKKASRKTCRFDD
ncbi:peptidyl-tRNA hydrolase domain protein [Piedraia hortae CBS 480.64]|uniref:Peptidyl-tRNA hydrolase domain protein n=1 Tax=Piedraia hortae CBS 480.64 TaxID=1314780 RepID=A0A6A7BSC2_9PEZI|nr:peptidyl-tRNA hydrolase domain protein [Piedraia hortae CBS 480.64]